MSEGKTEIKKFDLMHEKRVRTGLFMAIILIEFTMNF
ncbi:MAG: hypothetical protein AMDU3_IPLC00002G0041 [Thermoplasmatales archaeon I-plasma]|jgi:hypothetical protein|nr:MAG: hypothetical protein AMDU3_IPLC00002G0041 [Thermoplasmatales archaeon I-plasma]